MDWPLWNKSSEPTDDALVASFLARRDDPTFRQLYRRHAGALYSLAYRLVGSRRDEADEIFQIAWIRAVERLDRFRGESSLRSWLSGFVVNCARERQRRLGRLVEVEDEELEEFESAEESDGSAVRSYGAPLRERLERAIDGLPVGYREVLVLHDIEGYTHPEIGRLLGIESGTSKSQLFRARRALRAALEPSSGLAHGG